MNIVGFDISHFKGIRKTTIRFSDHDTARVHTLVGLNESGKTTLLEALHSFSPDAETQLVVPNVKNVDEQREQWVPRDRISIFTGEVSITAHVLATESDWNKICEQFGAETGLELEEDGLPLQFTVELVHEYKNGDFQRRFRRTSISHPRIKTKRASKFRLPGKDELAPFWKLLWASLPTIAYYPTFVFDFPKKIYLTSRDETPRNRFYRRLFQDILDYDGNGYTIEESILARLHKEETRGIWDHWFSRFVGTTEEDKVKQVISRAERSVTDLVFSKWNEVFGEKVGAKAIAIDLQYEKGNIIRKDDGTEEEPTEHDAYIRFRVKDGSSLYSVEDRSLGFRWFFAFLLFTQFRIHREAQKPTIFLFDEPASNLHAAAQKKLLESFPAIARSPHRLLYSTHSHYMVEPRWLEQAYIVFDQSAGPDATIIAEGVRSDSQVDIQAIPYRQFVTERPLQTSYFQPILDTLEVQPSHFDYKVGGLIVEGKGDYYFLRFAAAVTGKKLGPVFPATGSGTMGALVSLHRGWGLPVRVLFDSDRGGKDGKRNLVSEFALGDHESVCLGELSSKLKQIEDIFSKSDQDKLGGTDPGRRKVAILRRVQEMLAANEIPQLTKETTERMTSLANGVLSFVSGRQ